MDRLFTKRQKVKFTKLMLAAGALMLSLYSLAVLVICYRTGQLPPDTLTISFFGYWAIEGGWSMLIKTAEIRQQKQTPEPETGPGSDQT